MFDVVKTTLWFKTKNPLLGDISPRGMIRCGRCEKLQRFVMDALQENEGAVEEEEGRARAPTEVQAAS